MIGGGALLLVGAWGGWTVRDWKRDSEVLKGIEVAGKKLEEAREVVDNAATAYEQEKQVAAAQFAVRENTIREIYRDRPVSTDCAVPDAARSVLDRAVDAANARATGKPASTLSTSSEAAGAPQ